MSNEWFLQREPNELCNEQREILQWVRGNEQSAMSNEQRVEKHASMYLMLSLEYLSVNKKNWDLKRMKSSLARGVWKISCVV